MLVLLHSPVVGPLTWRAVAERLRESGHEVVVPSLAGVVETGPPYHLGLARRAAEQIPDGPVTLVAHSGAGALLPAITELLTDVRGAVFVDAMLPHPGHSWLDAAPPELARQARDLAVDGWLPPWHQCFPPEVVASVLPDEELRARFIAELPRIPLAYYAEPAPDSGRWPPPCGYLQLSEPYGPTADEAERLGWTVVRESLDHLAMLTRPDTVAAALRPLLG